MKVAVTHDLMPPECLPCTPVEDFYINTELRSPEYSPCTPDYDFPCPGFLKVGDPKGVTKAKVSRARDFTPILTLPIITTAGTLVHIERG